jgi:hypothetical protein
MSEVGGRPEVIDPSQNGASTRRFHAGVTAGQERAPRSCRPRYGGRDNERVGVAAFHNRIGLRGQFGHDAPFIR